jgi:hypothetical protein
MANAKCWSCGNVAHMTPIRGSGTQRIFRVGSDRYRSEVMACFKCDSCAILCIGYEENEGYLDIQGDEAEWLGRASGGLKWLPPDTSSKAYSDVPDEIASAASEGYKCLIAVGAYRAAVLLGRAVIEATAKSKGITAGSLAKKIDAMYDARLIREHVRDGAHEVRYLGNDMAHGDFVEPVLKEDAELVLTLMDEVLEEVFQSPARVYRRQQARLAKATAKDSTSPG